MFEQSVTGFSRPPGVSCHVKLVEPKTVQPGEYEVEWDGALGHGVPATFGVPHTIRVTANDQTRHVKVTAVDSR